MLDTKGPEFRIKTFADGKIFLEDGDKFTFTTDEVIGDKNKVSVTYKKLNEELVPGDRILLNNGLLIFSVDSIEGNDINCTVICGGELSDRKEQDTSTIKKRK
jgi:pyruvate kinase